MLRSSRNRMPKLSGIVGPDLCRHTPVDLMMLETTAVDLTNAEWYPYQTGPETKKQNHQGRCRCNQRARCRQPGLLHGTGAPERQSQW